MTAHRSTAPLAEVETSKVGQHDPEQAWYSAYNVKTFLRYKVLGALTHGSSVDVHALQAGSTKEASRLERMHECQSLRSLPLFLHLSHAHH